MARLPVRSGVARAGDQPANFILERLMGREAGRKRQSGYSLVTCWIEGVRSVSWPMREMRAKTKGWKRRPS